jgi:hypothetical protein
MICVPEPDFDTDHTMQRRVIAIGLPDDRPRPPPWRRTCPAPEARRCTYPVTRTVDQQDNYHGTAVADPYRWLEDANSDETHAWVEAQNKLTQGYLAQIPGPRRDPARA